MSDITLESAYRCERHTFGIYALYSRPAHDAIKRARDNLARYHEARDAFAMVKADNSPKYRDALTRASRLRLNVTAPGRDYGPGTWQDDSRKFAAHDETAQGVFREVMDAPGLDHTGWNTDPHGDVFKDGTGLCIPIIARLRNRAGRCVWVSGYRFGGHEDHGTFDMASPSLGYDASEDANEDAKRDAARLADSMAEAAAESEREYQTAWQAGQQWADALESEKATRAETLELLRQNRESGGSRDLPAIHATIRAAVCAAWDNLCTSRANRKALAEGEDSTLYFYPDERLKDAFCEGAGLVAYPA